jgi:hypothetical protein
MSRDTPFATGEAVAWLEAAARSALDAARKGLTIGQMLTDDDEQVARRTISVADEILAGLAGAQEAAMRAKVMAGQVRDAIKRQDDEEPA